MKIFRYTVISTVMLLLFCNVGLTVEKSSKTSATPKATTPLQTLPVQKSPTAPKPGTQKMIALPAKITVNSPTITYGQYEITELKIALADGHGEALSGRTIIYDVEWPGQDYCLGCFPLGCHTDRLGRAEVKLTYKPGESHDFLTRNSAGKRKITVTFAGDNKAGAASATGTLTIKEAGTTMTLDVCHVPNGPCDTPFKMGETVKFIGHLHRMTPYSARLFADAPVDVSVNGSAQPQVFPQKGFVRDVTFVYKWVVPVTAGPVYYKFQFSFPGQSGYYLGCQTEYLLQSVVP